MTRSGPRRGPDDATYFSSTSNVFASFRSAVSKPSARNPVRLGGADIDDDDLVDRRAEAARVKAELYRRFKEGTSQ